MKNKKVLLTVITVGILATLAFFAYPRITKDSSTPDTNRVIESKTLPEWAVMADDSGNILSSINPSVTEAVLDLKQGDKSNVIDPRNNLPVSPNVLTFMDSLNENNAYAVSGALTATKDIQKLYKNLWEGATVGGISLRNIISTEEKEKGIKDTDPNPGMVLAIYDASSDLEYCAVDQTYFGMKRASLSLYYQLLVPMSCADFAKAK